MDITEARDKAMAILGNDYDGLSHNVNIDRHQGRIGDRFYIYSLDGIAGVGSSWESAIADLEESVKVTA